MLTLKQAQKIILHHAQPFGKIKVLPEESLGYVLAKDIISPLDVPSFANSAMDGYAVRFSDIKGASSRNPIALKIIEEIPAGYLPRKRVGSGEASLIMTGSPLPQGADTVVMVEDTKKLKTNEVIILKKVKKGKNIRKKGEVIRKGKILLKKGTLIRPQEIALLATVNIDLVLVYRKPVVAVLSTGDEIVPLGEKISVGKIIDSNRYGVMAQLKNLGLEVIYDLGIAKDVEKEIEKKIKEGLENADLLLTIGGVSVGEWDLVKKIMARLGKIIFWKVNVRPGGPITFGKIAGKLWFGLPGNPVASLVAFEQFVRPALLKMSGRVDYLKPTFEAILENEYRGHAGKLRLERTCLSYHKGKYYARLVRSLGSADMRSMTETNAIIFVPERISHLRKGQKVSAQFL